MKTIKELELDLRISDMKIDMLLYSLINTTLNYMKVYGNEICTIIQLLLLLYFIIKIFRFIGEKNEIRKEKKLKGL